DGKPGRPGSISFIAKNLVHSPHPANTPLVGKNYSLATICWGSKKNFQKSTQTLILKEKCKIFLNIRRLGGLSAPVDKLTLNNFSDPDTLAPPFWLHLPARVLGTGSDGLDGFWAGFRCQHNRAAFIAKSAPHLVGQILLVLLGKKFVAVNKKHEGRRRLLDLRGVKKLQTVAALADGLAALDCVLQSAIENSRGNFLLQLGSDISRSFEQTLEVKAGFGRSENHRRVIKKEQVLLHPLAELGERGHHLGRVLAFLFVPAFNL